MFKPDPDFDTYQALNQLHECARGYEDEEEPLDDDTESLTELFRKYTQ